MERNQSTHRKESLERKKGHGQYVKEKLVADKDSRSFHRNINAIIKSCEQETWDVRILFPDRPDDKVAEILAEFFNKISAEYEPLMEDQIPESHECILPQLKTADVSRRLQRMSKPTSLVPGDLPAVLYKHFATKLAVPITVLFNGVVSSFSWPTLWNTEHVTVIPKIPSPEAIDQCRNISCTNFLSKVLESFVLDWAREEIKLKHNQYGGELGCGPAHFLIELNDFIASSLEDNRAAVVLMSMDFSKAFNRLHHATCLREFKKKGASTQFMKLVACFLRGHKMTVKVGEARRSSRLRIGNVPIQRGH